MLWMVCVGMMLTYCGRAQGQTGGYDAPFFQADFIEDLSDFSSGLVNPALLYRVNQYRLEGGFYRWEMDEAGSTTPLGYQEMSFLVPIRLNHTIGLSWIGTGSTIDRTTIDFNDATNTIRDLGEANFGDNWFVGHYSWRILPWFIAGANAKLRYESKFGMSQQLAVGLDLGVYVNPMDHFRYGDLGFSLNLQDVVPSIPIWHDTGATLDQVGVTRVRAGVRYSGLNDKLVIDFEGVVDNALSDLYAGILKADTVWTNATPDVTKAYELKKAFRLSAHVKWQFIPQVWLKAGWANNNIPYIGFNFNFIYPLPEMINYLNYDVHIGYALPIAGQEDERGLTMMHRLSTDFGPTREQRESKRLYDQLILAPMDAYNEAMRLYLAGKYWEAAFAFGKVVSLYPNFYLNDKAAYYMGDSYKRLYMNETARAVFKSALEEYTTSDMRSKYLYGLETIDYREGKYEDALKNHAFITNLYGESDIRPDADYVAGEIHFLRKNYKAAEQLLSRIKAGVAVVFVRAVHAGDHQHREQEDGGGGREPEEHHSGHDAGSCDAAVAGRGEHEAWTRLLRAGGAAQRGGGVQAGARGVELRGRGAVGDGVVVDQGEPAGGVFADGGSADRVAPGIAAGAGGVFAEGVRADAAEEVPGCDRALWRNAWT